MPYRPPNQSRLDQARQWYRDHPEIAQQLKEMGIAGDDPILLDPEFQKEHPELFPYTQESLGEKTKAWYKKHPKGDPQSTVSKVLEFFGLDQPYTNDSRSYDYNQKQWQKSLDEGNPDLSWFLPELGTDDAQDVLNNTMDNNYGDPDPRTDPEKWSGRIMDFLNFPMLGMEDEALAGVSSILNGSTYDEELDKSRRIKRETQEHSPIWSRIPSFVGALPLDAPLYAGTAALTGKAGAKLAEAAGVMPRAGGLGERVASHIPAAAGIAVDDSLWQLGNADGSVSDRVDQFDPHRPVILAAIPAAGAAMDIIGNGVSKAFGAGKRVLRKKPPIKPDMPPGPTRPRAPDAPKPGAPSNNATGPLPPKDLGDAMRDRVVGKKPKQPTVRDDIARAMEERKRRK